MNWSVFDLDPAHERSSPTRDGVLLNELSELSGNSEVRRPSVDLAVKPQNKPCIGTTQPGGVFDERREHRVKIEGRAADHLEDFTRGRLLLQSLSNFTIAFLQFFEQSNIFNCDHSLVSKGFEESDLLLGERIDYRTSNKNNPNRNLFAQEWHGKYGSITFSFGDSPELRKFSRGYGQHILYVDYLTVDHRPATR